MKTTSDWITSIIYDDDGNDDDEDDDNDDYDDVCVCMFIILDICSGRIYTQQKRIAKSKSLPYLVL